MNASKNSLDEVGKNAMAAIREMVAALECNYDRLDELREERQTWIDAKWEDDENGEPANGKEIWSSEFPDESKELAELESEAGECNDREEAEERIREDPLSIEFRSGWTTDKSEMVAEEAKILLTTGGPAVQIIVELDNGEPHRAYLQVQDWGTPWTEYYEPGIDETLTTYVRCFCLE